MPAAKKKAANSSGVLSCRLKDKLQLAPAILGFSNLVDPDDKFGDPKYQAMFHMTEEQIAANIEKLASAGEKCMEKFNDLHNTEFDPVDADEWLRSRIKEPNENARQQVPFTRLSLKHKEGVSQKTGKPYVIKPRVWDKDGNLLDARKLRLGNGSVVMPVVSLGIFTSGVQKEPCFSLRLEGVRVLKLVQYGGGGAGLEDIDDEDIELANIEDLDDDLSAYAFEADTDDDVLDDDATADGEEF